MRIILDGDACPNRQEIKRIAQKYHREMIVFTDYAHEMSDDYYTTIMCEVGKDSVDMKLLSTVQFGDLVVTQDYGLASLLLSKGVVVLHTTGKAMTLDNIDGLLMSRYMSQKERKATGRLKGPKKRTQEDKNLLLKSIEEYIKRG